MAQQQPYELRNVPIPDGLEITGPPFGIGTFLGSGARGMIEQLAPSTWQPGDRRRWQAADYWSLTSLYGFERECVPLLGRESLDHSVLHGPEEAKREFEQVVSRLTAAFHDALPFDDTERRWAVDVFERELGGGGGVAHERRAATERFRATEDELTIDGVAQVVSGRELGRRWWAWRRNADEFAERGSLDDARAALRGLTELLSPRDRNPAHRGWPHEVRWRQLVWDE